MIDFSINRENLARNIRKARENNIILPTISQLKNPDLIPGKIKDELKSVGMQDFSPDPNAAFISPIVISFHL